MPATGLRTGRCLDFSPAPPFFARAKVPPLRRRRTARATLRAGGIPSIFPPGGVARGRPPGDTEPVACSPAEERPPPRRLFFTVKSPPPNLRRLLRGPVAAGARPRGGM